MTGYLATLGGRRLEVQEDENGDGGGVYMASVGDQNSQFGTKVGKWTKNGKETPFGTKEDNDLFALSLLLNGCR